MRDREIYLGIDLLRFIAAMMVMGYHLGFKAWSLDGQYLHEKLGVPSILWPWSNETWFGWIGVQIFFVISGFVIAFSSENSSPTKFISGRVARLAPVMWISATACLAVALYWQTFSPTTVALLYVKSIAFFPFGPWIAGQIWTLPIEIMFYSLVLLLLVFKRFEHIDWVCLALALTSAGYWFAAWSGVYVETTGRITQLFLLQHGCFFALGVALWLIKRRGIRRINVAIVLLSVAPTWLQIKASLVWENPGFGLEAWPVVPYTVWAGTMALMAASIYWNGAISHWLVSGRHVIMLLGRITYPLYLVHYHVGGAVMIMTYDAGFSPQLSILSAFAASIATAYSIAHWMERPIATRLALLVQFVLVKRKVAA